MDRQIMTVARFGRLQAACEQEALTAPSRCDLRADDRLVGFIFDPEHPERRFTVEVLLPQGPARVWLHADGKTATGWIIVAIGERDWSRLAYQFGHELGHVTANSWRPDAKPAAPSQ